MPLPQQTKAHPMALPIMTLKRVTHGHEENFSLFKRIQPAYEQLFAVDIEKVFLQLFLTFYVMRDVLHLDTEGHHQTLSEEHQLCSGETPAD